MFICIAKSSNLGLTIVLNCKGSISSGADVGSATQIISGPASAIAFAYSIDISSASSKADSTSFCLVLMYLTSFSTPSRCPVRVKGPVIPTIIGRVSPYLSFNFLIASSTTGIRPLLRKSSGILISLLLSNGLSTTWGVLSLLPRSTLQPMASASTVRQNGILAHSNPASS